MEEKNFHVQTDKQMMLMYLKLAVVVVKQYCIRNDTHIDPNKSVPLCNNNK